MLTRMGRERSCAFLERKRGEDKREPLKRKEVTLIECGEDIKTIDAAAEMVQICFIYIDEIPTYVI